MDDPTRVELVSIPQLSLLKSFCVLKKKLYSMPPLNLFSGSTPCFTIVSLSHRCDKLSVNIDSHLMKLFSFRFSTVTRNKILHKASDSNLHLSELGSSSVTAAVNLLYYRV
jgi:hypothetical protein